ncbi:hypothetical protein GCM10009555_060510 [Acrocarpospora macrocephala]|uniref:Uncharacterized protein n=1 Tax=Acrocarpospora macrocephala TaxID=150177 RepID=A0A5M3WTZ5_9ACTN|nr:hypothetical protein Amac_036800 [Acrocarpospora macrocephala]
MFRVWVAVVGGHRVVRGKGGDGSGSVQQRAAHTSKAMSIEHPAAPKGSQLRLDRRLCLD